MGNSNLVCVNRGNIKEISVRGGLKYNTYAKKIGAQSTSSMLILLNKLSSISRFSLKYFGRDYAIFSISHFSCMFKAKCQEIMYATFI